MLRTLGCVFVSWACVPDLSEDEPADADAYDISLLQWTLSMTESETGLVSTHAFATRQMQGGWTNSVAIVAPSLCGMIMLGTLLWYLHSTSAKSTSKEERDRDSACSILHVQNGIGMLVYAMAIVDSYDFAEALGKDEVFSGFIVSASNLGSACGNLLAFAVTICCPDIIYKRLCTVNVCATLLLTIGAAAYTLIAWNVRAGTTWMPCVTLLSRFIAGIGEGLISLFTDITYSALLSKAEMAERFVEVTMTRSFAIGLGPGIASLAHVVGGPSIRTSTLVLPCLLTMQLLFVFVNFPQSLQRKNVKDDGFKAEAVQHQYMRRSIVVAAGVFVSSCRAWSTTSVEVASSLILEEQYAMSTRTIGLLIALPFLLSIPAKSIYASCKNLMTLQSFVRLLEVIVLLGCFGLLDALLPILRQWWILLFADALMFPCLYLIEGLVASVVYQQIIPDDPIFNAPNVGIVWIVFIQLSRFVAPPTTRNMIANHGQTGYGLMQMGVLAIMALLFEVGVKRGCDPVNDSLQEDPVNDSLEEDVLEVDPDLVEPVIVITTGAWTCDFFKHLILPYGRYAVSDIIFCDISSGTLEQNLEKLEALLQKSKLKARCFATGDAGMELYAVAKERLNGYLDLKGAHLYSFLICTNKLACRRLVAGCDSVQSYGVTSDQEFLPDMGRPGFFKPLAGTASMGVFKYEGVKANPLRGAKNIEETPLILEMTGKMEKLRPFMNENLVGLVEEYMDPTVNRKVVAADGFICDGKVYRYILSDNFYRQDEPEVFDCTVTPTQQLSDLEANRVWELFDKVMNSLVQQGMDNQFVDLEIFVMPDRVEIMEINARAWPNQLPVFSMLFGPNCVFSATLDALAGDVLKTVDIPPDCRGMVGVCCYVAPVEGQVSVVKSAHGEVFYYPVPGRCWHHVYSTDKTFLAAKQKCLDFYTELTSKAS